MGSNLPDDGYEPLGVVLSGGGARGAYEVGVLSYIFGDLVRLLGTVPHYDIVCGTSVGAINGTFLAAVADDPVAGLPRLKRVWGSITLPRILRFGFRQAMGLRQVLLGGASARGLFDASAVSELVVRAVPWARVARNLRMGRLRALTVTATHVATGRPVVFVDRSPDTPLPMGLPPNVYVRGEHIEPHHVLASAAIPVVFPPVRIHQHLYCDGGLRLNTPMAPAVHMGAKRMLVIGVSTPGGDRGPPAVPAGKFPGAPFLLGKVLNAFLLDHIHTDLEELDRINRFLSYGEAVYGPDFVERINTEAISRGEAPHHIVRKLAISPSVDIGRIAGDHLRRHRSSWIGRKAWLRLLDLGEGSESDLASYLLFDGKFASRLMDLGRADAAARREELADFFFSR